MFPWDGVETPDTVRPQDMLALGDVSYAPLRDACPSRS